MKNKNAQISLFTDKGILLTIDLNKNYNITYNLIFNTHIFVIEKLISFDSNNLQNDFNIIKDNLKYITKMEYKCNNAIIVSDNYIEPEKNINLSYSITDFNKERIEIAYVDRSVVND